MKKISLTQGRVALVDDSDYDWLNQWKWYALPDRDNFYAARAVRIAKNKRGLELMHRVILGLQPGDKRQGDHKDGNGLNNRGSNLRVCTLSQNLQSQRKWMVGASEYKGVCWDRDYNKWRSQIYVNKKEVYLGLFDSETDAAAAYNAAASRHFGEFALLNTF